MYKKMNKSPEKKAVSYFNHFPSNFLKPYGKANLPPDEETIQRRINPVSCEWFLRPKVAMSEFSATVTENLLLLKDENFQLIRSSKFNHIYDSMQPFLNALNKLNTKSDEPSSQEDVNAVMSTIYDDGNALDRAVDEMFVVGGAMFSTAIQYIVARSIMSDPTQYSEKLVTDDQSTKAFKQSKSVTGLQRFLNQQCIQHADDHLPQTSASSRRDLLRQLQQGNNVRQEDEDPPQQLQDETNVSSSTLKRKKEKKQKKPIKKSKK